MRNGCTATAPATVTFLSTLPIKLTSFAGMLINKNTIDAKWSVAGEDGTENYILERSVDGIHFTTIYNIHAAGISNENNYGYRDDVTTLSSSGSVFYRVKVYSHSVLYSVSKIVKINLNQI
ncbi:MAG: hypothetical protein M3004_02930 [Bacteroidota bacterium]|nr:hypothetical protein [Bacteroidota bacterium]